MPHLQLNTSEYDKNHVSGIRHPTSLTPSQAVHLLGFEEKNRAVPKVEVYEVLGLCMGSQGYKKSRKFVDQHTMRDERAKVTAYNAVPGWTLAIIKLYERTLALLLSDILRWRRRQYSLLDELGNILFNIVLAHALLCCLIL